VHADQIPGVEQLLEISRAGGPAASDYLEDAVLAGVSPEGCRRCGEGFTGETGYTNVLEGARLGLTLDPDVLVVEGSGAVVVPIDCDRTICVTPATLAREQALSYLGPLRLMRADMILVLGASALARDEIGRLEDDLRSVAPGAEVIACELRPAPVEGLDGEARVALFTSSQGGCDAARDGLLEQGIDPVTASANLGRRGALRDDLEAAERAGCTVFLTELKAAAIDSVAEAAVRLGARVEFLRLRPVAVEGYPDLDERMLALADAARHEVGSVG
jgi:cyclic 2,3-diphosphoglycerate synthetase